MGQNIVETLREESVKRLFATKGFANVWPKWQSVIQQDAPTPTAKQIIDLGDHLKDIFYSTNTNSRKAPAKSTSSKANWESLVCWYLNICNIGRRTVCIKTHKSLMPVPIIDAITVDHGDNTTDSASDLIVITFPDLPEYSLDVDNISIHDKNGKPIPLRALGKYNISGLLDALVARDFSKIEIHAIQCQIKWDSNAQVATLWDMAFSITDTNSDTTIGTNGYNVRNAKAFSYSFVTVPNIEQEKFKSDSLCVSQVRNLSGGNYWGCPSKDGVANSIKEMLNKNLFSGASQTYADTLTNMISELKPIGQYSYFQFPYAA